MQILCNCLVFFVSYSLRVIALKNQKKKSIQKVFSSFLPLDCNKLSHTNLYAKKGFCELHHIVNESIKPGSFFCKKSRHSSTVHSHLLFIFSLLLNFLQNKKKILQSIRMSNQHMTLKRR